MTRSGGNYDEMGTNDFLDDGLEAMVTGSLDPDHPLGYLLGELRDSAMGWPAPDQAAEHVAAAVQQARLNVPAPALSGASMSPGRRTTTRRRTVIRFLTSTLIGKILAGSVAFAAAGGSLAATGNLPAPAQTAVANTVQVVGIHIPDPADDPIADSVDTPPADETADSSDGSKVADLPAASETPEATDASNDAEVTDTTEAPEATDAPEDAEVVEAPEAPEVTETTEAPEAPEVTETTEAPETTETTEAPEAPEAGD